MSQLYYGKTPEDLGRGLYILSTGEDGPCKVGITNDLALRISVLQVGNWMKIQPVMFTFVIAGNVGKLNMWSAFSNGSVSLEGLVHKKLKELDLHLSGEWFDIGEKDCIAVVKKVASNEGFRLAGPEVLQSISNYTSLPARQIDYIQAMINAEQSAQRAFEGRMMKAVD